MEYRVRTMERGGSLQQARDFVRVIEMAQEFLATSMFGQFAQATDEQLGALAIRAQGCGEIFLLEAISKAGVEVVGFLAMVALEHAIDGRRYGDELAWWVAPDHRGARAGGFLLATAESWARENGLSMVKMVAPADSTIGEFYVRHGYAAVETSYQKVLS